LVEQQTLAAGQNVTRIIAMTSVTAKASAKHDLLLNKPASSKHLRLASDLTSTTRQIGSKIIKVIVKILGHNFL
jgi:hypothetical protein